MVLTKRDLQDWNNQPVTKAVFEGVKNSLHEVEQESCLRATADETAMRTAYNEGVAAGIRCIQDGYEIMLEDAE